MRCSVRRVSCESDSRFPIRGLSVGGGEAMLAANESDRFSGMRLLLLKVPPPGHDLDLRGGARLTGSGCDCISCTISCTAAAVVDMTTRFPTTRFRAVGR